MRCEKFLAVLFVILLFSPFAIASGNYLPSYNSWHFESDADNSTHEVRDSQAKIFLENGVISISAYLLKDIKKGTAFKLNVSWDISPTSVMAGIKVMMNDDTLLEKTISEKNEKSFEIFALKDYKKGARFVIIFYNLGGSMHLDLEPIKVEIPKSDMNSGVILAVVGISVVFMVLGILAAVMYVMKYTAEPSKKKPSEKGKEVPIKKDIVEKKEKKEVDEETVAAITGALSLYLGGKKFRIISVKPSPWKYYGRLKSLRRWK